MPLADITTANAIRADQAGAWDAAALEHHRNAVRAATAALNAELQRAHDAGMVCAVRVEDPLGDRGAPIASTSTVRRARTQRGDRCQ